MEGILDKLPKRYSYISLEVALGIVVDICRRVDCLGVKFDFVERNIERG